MNVLIPAVYALPVQPTKARISMHALVTNGGSAAGFSRKAQRVHRKPGYNGKAAPK